jgi:hypothetical protein
MPNVIEIPPLNMGFDWLAHFNLISPETTRWWMAQYLRKGGFKSYKVIATNQQKRQQLEEPQSTELWLSFVQQGQEISREVFLDETSDAAFITNWSNIFYPPKSNRAANYARTSEGGRGHSVL